MKVAWLLPVKNAEKYLPKCLESILSQTYKEQEVFACDNGSTDDSKKILEDWIPSKIPGRVFSMPNANLGEVLAFLVNEAKHEICLRIDADDFNLKNRAELQINYLKQHPDVGLLGGRAATIDESGAEKNLINMNWYDDASLKWRLRFANPFIHPTVAFRRSVVLATGNYPSLDIGEEYDLWFRLAPHTKFANLDQVLIKNRAWPGQHSRERDGIACNQKLVRDYREILYPEISNQDFERINKIFVKDFSQAKLSDYYLLIKIMKLSASKLEKSSKYYLKSDFGKFQLKRVITKVAIHNIKRLFFQKP